MSPVPVRLLLSLLPLNHYHVVFVVATFVVTEVYYDASIIQNNLDHTLCVLLLLMFLGKAQQHEAFIPIVL